MDKNKHNNYNERVGNADAMKHERAIILFAIIALLVGIPAGVFFRQKAELIESQINQRKQLERSIDAVQMELETKSHDSNTKASEIERLQREKSELEIKLQSRIDAKKIEVVARAQANEQPVVSKPPVVAVPPTNGGNIQEIIIKWANHYGVNANTLLRIAKCESGFNPLARNTNYRAGAAGNPVGLFQHVEGYWPARAAKYGVPGASIYDPDAQSRVTAGMFRDGQASAWECK